MSELIEINEENCVLSGLELKYLELLVNDISLDPEFKKTRTEIIQKINKLNDMAKRKMNQNIEVTEEDRRQAQGMVKLFYGNEYETKQQEEDKL